METRLFQRILDDYFPMGSRKSGATLEVVPDTVDIASGSIQATIRLFTWEQGLDGPMIRDIKEQVVAVGRHEHLQDLQRYREFLSSIELRFTGLEPRGISRLMPVDFFDIGLLDATSAHTREDFDEARHPKIITPARRFGGASPTFPEQIISAAFMPGTNKVGVFLGDYSLHLWDIAGASDTPLAHQPPFGPDVLAFTSLGELLGVDRRGVHRWDVETGDSTLLGDGSYGEEQFLIQDGFLRGHQFITYEEKGWSQEAVRLRIFDLHDETVETVFQYEPEHAGRLAPCGANVTADGATFIAVSSTLEEGRIFAWDLKAGEPIAEFAVDPNDVFLGSSSSYHRDRVQLSSDGQLMATMWGSTNVFDLQDGSLRYRVASEQEHFSVGRFYEGDQRLVTISERGLRIVDVDSGGVVGRVDFEHEAFVLGCALDEDARRLVVIDDQSLLLFELPDCSAVAHQAGHSGRVSALTVSPDGRLLASSGAGTVKLWDLKEDKPRWTKALHNFGKLVFSPDGSSIMVTDSSVPVRLDCKDGREIFRAETRASTSVFTADNSSVHLRYDEDHTEGSATRIHLFQGEPLTEKATGRGPYFRCVPQMDTRGELGIFHDEGTVFGWDLVRMEELWRATRDLVDIRLSSDGRLVAVKTYDQLVVFDARTGAELGAVDHFDLVYAFDFSPDCSHLALADKGEGLVCTQVAVFRLCFTSPTRLTFLETTRVKTEHAGEVTALAFSPDGNRLFTGGADGTIELHEIRP